MICFPFFNIHSLRQTSSKNHFALNETSLDQILKREAAFNKKVAKIACFCLSHQNKYKLS